MNADDLKEFEARWLPDWQQVWQRDDPYHAYDLARCEARFDHDRAELIWVSLEEPGDSPRQERAGEKTTSSELIPPLHHSEHHEIFREFVRTLPEAVGDLCNTRSISGFRDDLEFHFPEQKDEIWDSWISHHDGALRGRAEKWLRARGFRVNWVHLA